VAAVQELQSKTLRALARRLKPGYELERTRANHFRLRDPDGELVQWKGKNLTLNQNEQHEDAMTEQLEAVGALKPAGKQARERKQQSSSREAYRETQRQATLRRQELSAALRDRMQPWLQKIGGDTPGVTFDLARYLHANSNGAFSSPESATSAIRNIQSGQGVKDETRQPIEQLSARFEAEEEPLLLYLDLAREVRGIEAPTTSVKEWPFTMKLVDVDACFPDMEYQRPVTDHGVREIVLAFDERKVGSVQVSAREDGRFAILDGQRRWRAVQVIGKKRLWAAVYDGMNLADEARFFYELNHDRKQIHPYYGFRARVLAGEPKIVEIDRMVREVGLKISSTTDWAKGQIAAVAALEMAYDQPSDVREDTLGPGLRMMGIWKGQRQSTANELIRGFGRFYAAFGDDEIQQPHFDELLKELGPGLVLARAREEADKAGRVKQGSSSTGVMCGRALVLIHNTGLPREQRLTVTRIRVSR